MLRSYGGVHKLLHLRINPVPKLTKAHLMPSTTIVRAARRCEKIYVIWMIFLDSIVILLHQIQHRIMQDHKMLRVALATANTKNSLIKVNNFNFEQARLICSYTTTIKKPKENRDCYFTA